MKLKKTSGAIVVAALVSGISLAIASQSTAQTDSGVTSSPTTTTRAVPSQSVPSGSPSAVSPLPTASSVPVTVGQPSPESSAAVPVPTSVVEVQPTTSAATPLPPELHAEVDALTRESLAAIRSVRTTPDTNPNARASASAVENQKSRGAATLESVLAGTALRQQVGNLNTVTEEAAAGSYKQLDGSMVVNNIIDRVQLGESFAVRAAVTDSVHRAVLNEQGEWIESKAQADRIANLLIERGPNGDLQVVQIVFDEVTAE